MPRAALRIGKWVSDLGKCAVHSPSSLGFRRLVDRGADERMSKTNASVDLEQAGRFSRCASRRADPESLGGAPQQRRVAEWFRCRHQQQLLRVRRQQLETLAEALLDPALE